MPFRNQDFETAPPFVAAQTADNWIDGTAAGSSTNAIYGWWASPRATAIAVQFDSTVSHSGTYSLKVSTTNTTGRARIFSAKASGGSIVSGSTNQPFFIPVRPGGTYTFSGWAKTNNVAAGGVFLEIVEITSSLTVGTSTGSSTLTGTNDWTALSVTVTVGATTNWLVVDMQNATAGNVSDAWFDDLVLTGTGLDATGYIPTRLGNRNVGPSVLRYMFRQPQLFTPPEVATSNQTVVPNVATLTTSSFAPTLLTPQTVIPGVKALLTTKFAPQIGLAVIPGLAHLSLSAFLPIVLTPRTVVPGVRSLTTTRFSPVLNLSIIPSVKALSISTFAPLIVRGTVSKPGIVTLTTTRFAISIRLTVIPSIATLSVTGFAPVIVTGANRVVIPSSGSLVTTKFAVTVLLPRTTVPGIKSLISTKYPPVILRGVVPGKKSLVISSFAPTIVNPHSLVPSVLSLRITLYPPNAHSGLRPGSGSTPTTWSVGSDLSVTVGAGSTPSSSTWLPGNMV